MKQEENVYTPGGNPVCPTCKRWDCTDRTLAVLRYLDLLRSWEPGPEMLAKIDAVYEETLKNAVRSHHPSRRRD